MQCKDIPDLPVLKFIADINNRQEWPKLATWFWTDNFHPAHSVINAMPDGTPEKLGLAKIKMLMRRGLVEGCDCGCRGDFELTEKGKSYIAENA